MTDHQPEQPSRLDRLQQNVEEGLPLDVGAGEMSPVFVGAPRRLSRIRARLEHDGEHLDDVPRWLTTTTTTTTKE
jgi:hypothetical protein